MIEWKCNQLGDISLHLNHILDILDFPKYLFCFVICYSSCYGRGRIQWSCHCWGVDFSGMMCVMLTRACHGWFNVCSVLLIFLGSVIMLIWLCKNSNVCNIIIVSCEITHRYFVSIWLAVLWTLHMRLWEFIICSRGLVWHTVCFIHRYLVDLRLAIFIISFIACIPHACVLQA